MFGLFFEDINYGLDGGLYAEMLENRHFEFMEGRGRKYNYYQYPAFLYGWNPYPGNSKNELIILDQEPLNSINPHYLCADIKQSGGGFSNKAYDGIFLKAAVGCYVSFYAKMPENYSKDGCVRIQLLTKDGMIAGQSKTIAISSDSWQKYEEELEIYQDVEAGQFTVVFEEAARIYFDQFSMMPKDAVYGIFRKDLAELLKNLNPGFLRFPGGCVVEGNELTNRYRWKQSVGKVEERKSNWNRWAVHGNDLAQREISEFAYYNQTLGVGYYEYFLLCEYLGCAPLPIANVGAACQYQSREKIASDSPEFQEYIKDALDLIEFANGAPDSEWGSVRASMGHPESFHLTMIGIGNEQWETPEFDFFRRYELFEEAIHKVYPEIKCIGSAGPDVTSQHYEDAWNYFSPQMKENDNYAYAIDEHYYVSDEWLYEHVHMYDKYPRHQKVFAGEYACHIHPEEAPEKRNSFAAALAEAAFMTGLEKNCDVVLMASYAPLLARIGYNQWQPNLIWFDAKTAYGSPSYYVQQLYSCYTGTELLDVNSKEADGIYTTASRSENGIIYLKIINISNQQQTIEIGDIKGSTDGTLWSLTGNLSDCNSIDERQKICPTEQSVNILTPQKVEANSINVLIFKTELNESNGV